MESSVTLRGVSFRKNPRIGQLQAVEAAADPSRSFLNVQLPTGYGKTLVANGVYAVLCASGRVNRMLIIFPTEAQYEQYLNSSYADLRDVSLDDHKVADMRAWSQSRILSAHRKNTHTIFAITIQALIQTGGMNNVQALLETGQWLIVVDEHHHYGADKTWGSKVKNLNRQFLLAMSATPYRKDNDNAFGAPDIEIPYRKAVDEGAIKPLRGHAYYYRLDLIKGDGEIMSVSPNELVEMAGGDSPLALKKITKDMRLSAKYISPLVSEPLYRLMHERLAKNPYLQALVGCMWVEHAKQVCQQIKAMFPELRVDWVGTGPDGRQDNQAVLDKFCPKKGYDGNRPNPELDVLVHVGVAGEGLDTVLVSEIIHLNAANLCNQNNQENGRASRNLYGVIGNINFDSTSGYAQYVGASIMDAMDMNPPQPDEKEPAERIDGEYKPLPDEPFFQIHNIELDHIDSGDPDLPSVKKMLTEPGKWCQVYTREDILNPDHPLHVEALEFLRNMRKKEAMQFDERSQETALRKSINEAISVVTGLVLRMHKQNGVTIEKSLPGDIKKRIYTQKRRDIGSMEDVEGLSDLRHHYAWIKNFERNLLSGGLPLWLL
jgi:superfamily II DNA or RNA helicase